MGKRKQALINQVSELSHRVADLEERLCPYSSHDWMVVGAEYIPDGYGGSDTLYTYQCRTCGKIAKTELISVDTVVAR